MSQAESNMRLQIIDDTVCLANSLIEQLTEAEPEAEPTSIAGLTTVLLAKHYHGTWLDQYDLQTMFDLAEQNLLDELYAFCTEYLRLPYVCQFLPAINSYVIIYSIANR